MVVDFDINSTIWVYRRGFQLCQNWFAFVLILLIITTPGDWLEKCTPLSQPVSHKTKPIMACTHTFSNIGTYYMYKCICFIHISDWFILLSLSVVTGH